MSLAIENSRTRQSTAHADGEHIMRRIIIVTAIVFSFNARRPEGQTRFLNPQQVNALPSLPPDHRIRYGHDVEQFGELRLPRGMSGRVPVAVVLHGGCWKARHGDLVADVQNTAPLASALTKLGIATWNLEYRRIDQPGGGWPGTFEDVARGVDHLRALATSHPLDLTRVVIVGHSAGGHLGTWVAARKRLPRHSRFFSEDPLAIRGIVNLAGPADLESLWPMEQQACGEPVVTRLLGGSPAEVPERYAEASPAKLLPLDVRQVLITGAHDQVVPPALAQRYEESARATGDDVTTIVVADAAHFEVIAPGSTAWITLKTTVASMMEMGRE
jgi:acetyl esterase/lipase